MNKLKTLSYILLGVSVIGCNGLGKMAKNYPKVTHEVKPNPLEMHGDSVAVSIQGTYPPKYFANKVDVTVTPMVKSSTAEHNYKSIVNVGEKSETSGNKIASKAGGSFTYTDKIAYTADMRASDLMIKSVGAKGTKTKDLGSVKIADGVITTPLLVRSDEKPIIGKDKFERVTPANFDGTIYYLINTSNVNKSFKAKSAGITNAPEFVMLDSALQAITTAPYNLNSVSIMGYASPDGKEMINADLAENRSKSAAKYIATQLTSNIRKADKKSKESVSADSSMFSRSVTNEDWGGFQQLMQESDMPQKDMILRIVASNSDPEAREIEIKKMGKAYTEVAEQILPQLRRSAITLNGSRTGRSDEEITALVQSNPDSLSVDEILYAATLTTDNAQKMSIYQTSERLYPQDWRTSNNVGFILFLNGDIDGAMAQFSKADQLSANNNVVKNNMGAVYSRKGDRANASSNYAAAAGAGDEVNHNMGIIDIRNGNYTGALSHYGSENTFNAGLARLLSGDADGAMKTVNGSDDNETAIGYYLKAVISARKGDAAGVVSNLTTCIQKDPSMKSMAAEDREFIKWFGDASFKAVVQ